MAQMEFQEIREEKDFLVLMVPLVGMVNLGFLAELDLLESRVCQGRLVLRDSLERKDAQESQVFVELLVLMELMVFQERGAAKACLA